MKINLSDYENLCKDKRQPIIISRDNKSNCQHQAQNIVKQNNLQSAVLQYKIDDKIIIDGNKCDYLVLNDDLKTAYLTHRTKKIFKSIRKKRKWSDELEFCAQFVVTVSARCKLLRKSATCLHREVPQPP